MTENFITKYSRLGHILLCKYWHFAYKYEYPDKVILLHSKLSYILHGLFFQTKTILYFKRIFLAFCSIELKYSPLQTSSKGVQYVKHRIIDFSLLTLALNCTTTVREWEERIPKVDFFNKVQLNWTRLNMKSPLIILTLTFSTFKAEPLTNQRNLPIFCAFLASRHI